VPAYLQASLLTSFFSGGRFRLLLHLDPVLDDHLGTRRSYRCTTWPNRALFPYLRRWCEARSQGVLGTGLDALGIPLHSVQYPSGCLWSSGRYCHCDWSCRLHAVATVDAPLIHGQGQGLGVLVQALLPSLSGSTGQALMQGDPCTAGRRSDVGPGSKAVDLDAGFRGFTSL